MADFWAQEREAKKQAAYEFYTQTGPRDKHRVLPAPDVPGKVLSRLTQQYVPIDEVNSQLAEAGESDGV